MSEPSDQTKSATLDASETGAVSYDFRLYEETLALLEEARDLVISERHSEKPASAIGDRLTNSCESLRLTARLTQVMAWVLTQRAVFEGEVSEKKSFSPENRLGGWDVCSCTQFESHSSVPKHLRSLLRRSLQLYIRVKHLETNAMRRLGLPHDESEVLLQEHWAHRDADLDGVVSIMDWRQSRQPIPS
ncbi:MAG: DUF1465 family protein [Pseudomonadota bacterium]